MIAPPAHETVLESRIPLLLNLDEICYMDNKKFLEIADPNCLKALIESDFLLKQFNPHHYTQKYALKFFENEKQQLEKYLSQTNNGILTTTYKLPKHKLGRVNVSKAIGFTSLRRMIRNTLIKDNYIDIDLSNAQPTILYNICKQNNLPCEELGKLVNNREEVLTSVMQTYNVSRKIAKKLFLRMSFYGTFEGWVIENEIKNTNQTPYIKCLTTELITISKRIKNENKGLYKKVYDMKTEKDNVIGSFMAFYLQTWELRIISHAIKFFCEETQLLILKGSDIPVLTYEFDGIKIPKLSLDLWEGDLSSLMNKLEQVIEEKTGFKLTFEQKEIEEGDYYDVQYEPFIPSDNVTVLNEPTSFAGMKRKFEMNHAKIVNDSVFVKQDQHEVIIMPRTKLVCSYEHMRYEKKESTESFIRDWLCCPEIRKYERMGVFPHDITCPSDCFNLWTPFAMEEIKDYVYNQSAVEFITNHLYILCGNDTNVSNHFQLWIAQMIQFPSVKTNMYTFISKEGAGKNTILQLLKKMLGYKKVFETTNPARDVWGNFNGAMANSFLVNLNEVSLKDTSAATGFIKGLITDGDLMINNKGVSAFPITSYHRFISFTNNSEPFVTTKDDRRNVIVRSSDELIGNKDYFNKLYEYLEDQNAVKSCYEYFKNMKGADNFNKQPMPQTEYQTNLKELSVCPIESWIKYFTEVHEHVKDKTYDSSEIYEYFNTWKNEWNINYEINYIKFCVRLKNLNIEGIDTMKTNSKNRKSFDFDVLRKRFEIE